MAVGEVMEDFAGQTTAHGLGRIVGSGSMYLKMFWALMVVVALGVCGWQITLIFIKYYSYPTLEDTSINFGELEFPTISICNLNRFRASQKEKGGPEFLKLLAEFEKQMEGPEDKKLRRKRAVTFGLFDKECRSTREGTEYMGSADVTISGKTCQKWGLQKPHRHPFKSKHFPDLSLNKASNHCRNPSGAYAGPWCYTTDPDTRWERCDIPHCPGDDATVIEDNSTEVIDTSSDPEDSLYRTTATPRSEALADNLSDNNNDVGAFPPTEYESTEVDTSTDYFMPVMDVEGKPWLEAQGEPDPFVKNNELLGAALRGIPISAQRSMGYQVDSMVLECVFSGKTCSAANFTGFSNMHYGNCFTFNSGRMGPLLWSRKQGSLYGLSLTLFVDQDEYISALTPSAGVRVLLHRHDHQPFPEDGSGFDVGPGQKAAVSIRMRKTIRLPAPYANCTYSGDFPLMYPGSYTTAACQRTCIQKLTNQTCGCGDPTLPIVKGFEVCGSEDNNCLEAVKTALENKDLDCSALCPEPCSLVEYYPSVAASEWPADSVKPSIIEKFAVRGKKIEDALKKPGGVKKNLLKIEFFYDELRHTVIEHQPAYGIENFLGDIGGQLGLWIGISVLTMIEFIQLFIDIFTFCCCPRSSTKAKDGYEDLEDGAPSTAEKQ